MSTVKVRNLTIGSDQPKVCVSLIARNFEELFAEAMRVSKLDCDIIEWRADYFMYVDDLAFMRKAAYFVRYAIEDKPLIFTFRTLDEGGGQYIDPTYYFELNKAMIELGLIDAVDLELDMLLDQMTDIRVVAKKNNIKILMSSHNMSCTPSKEAMTELLYEMQDFGADICKLAVMPNDMSEVLKILETSNEIQINRPNMVFALIGMGEVGRLTRLTGELFGSSLSFASNGKHLSAPGQLPIKTLREGMDILGKTTGRGH